MGERAARGPVVAISPTQQMLASSTGALLTAIFVTPLDVVKIRLQAQQSPFYKALHCTPPPRESVVRPSKWKCFLYCNGLLDHIYVCQKGTSCSRWYNTQTHFSGTLDAFVKISRHEGLRSLWSGLPPALMMSVPATVIYFSCYDQLSDYLRYSLGFQGNHVPLVSGAVARCKSASGRGPVSGVTHQGCVFAVGAVTVISPLELMRTQMQSRRRPYRELLTCVRSALGRDGALSLWRGWGPTVLRDVPFSALYWFNYELVKTQLCQWSQRTQANFSISFTSGAVSGAIAAVLTLPFDVVKTRRQIQLGEMDSLGGSVKRTSSTWQILKEIWAELGYRGLFTGFLPRVFKVAPACAIMISTYEFGKSFFRRRNLDRERAATGSPGSTNLYRIM